MLLVKCVHCFRDRSWIVKLTIYLVNQQREEASVVVSDIKHTDFNNSVFLFNF